MDETTETDAGDHIAEFAGRHRLDETELRECIGMGPSWVRSYLSDMRIYDGYPRPSRAPLSVRAAGAACGSSLRTSTTCPPVRASK